MRISSVMYKTMPIETAGFTFSWKSVLQLFWDALLTRCRMNFHSAWLGRRDKSCIAVNDCSRGRTSLRSGNAVRSKVHVVSHFSVNWVFLELSKHKLKTFCWIWWHLLRRHSVKEGGATSLSYKDFGDRWNGSPFPVWAHSEMRW